MKETIIYPVIEFLIAFSFTCDYSRSITSGSVAGIMVARGRRQADSRSGQPQEGGRSTHKTVTRSSTVENSLEKSCM